jgi:NTP pyrophosphatase (non-canonical NTP hydrolase)
MSDKITKLNAKFAKVYDIEDMLCMLMEESAELIQACNKYLRYIHKKKSYKKKKKNVEALKSLNKEVIESLTEEIADTEIFIERIKMQLDIKESEIGKWKKAKLKRQQGRLRNERKNEK